MPVPFPEGIVTLILQIEKDLKATDADEDTQASVLQFFSVDLFISLWCIQVFFREYIFRNQQDDLMSRNAGNNHKAIDRSVVENHY